MNIKIVDIEVFEDDWILVARSPEPGSPHTVIHNDNAHLREWLDNVPDIIGGFNNKHYDDWVILTMYLGGSNVEVKRHNDFIIQFKGDPWAFPFIQFKRRPFKSFDLRDDIADEGVSLKSIEGNLRRKILESKVPFDLKRPLTEEELEEVKEYCKWDVDSTCDLFWKRKQDYLDAKILAGSIYDIDALVALSYTNAKLTAEALGAKYTERNDERDYVIPAKLPIERIPKIVYDFFMQIRDKSIPNEKLFGAGKGKKGMTLSFNLVTGGGTCPVTFAWGGVHGAVPCITVEVDKDYVLINQDVGSLYPNSMLNFGYCSRSMNDPEAYRRLVNLRLKYKAEAKKYNKQINEILGVGWYSHFMYEDDVGNLHFDYEKAKAETTPEVYDLIIKFEEADAKQSSLKLIINTTYGAMLAKGNGLYDPLMGRSVCITNQICMSILISDLAQVCKTIWFVNINTDGIMYRIHRSEAKLAQKVIDDWCELTGFTMEEDNFSKVIQKDVNNYIGIYDDGHFKTKGGYVSLYDGGNFKTNSLSVVHKAIVDYLVKGIDPETTIRECKDIFAFQQIIKTGGSYSGSYHYINGKLVEVQKVNRVYAVKDPIYGAVVKRKYVTTKNKKDKATGKMVPYEVEPHWEETVISECPEHCFIDNENVLRVEDLDLSYYIEMAKDRINKYITLDPKKERELKKITKEVVIMATEKTNMNIYQKLAEARKRFLEAPKKKSGKNTYVEFKYFELEDIVPVATQIFSDLGLVFNVMLDTVVAIGSLIDADNPDQKIDFSLPVVPLTVTDKNGELKSPAGMNSVQALGANVTYMRRYLYMLALDVVEADAIDATAGKANPESGATEAPKKGKKPLTEEERTTVKDDLIDKDGAMTEVQRKGLVNGLKKLRARYMDDQKNVTNEELEAKYDSYVKEQTRKIKSGSLTKKEAEALLIEIGDKIAE